MKRLISLLGVALLAASIASATYIPSSVSGPYGSVFDPDAKPASATSQDDEFDDSSFNTGKWTEWDYGSVLTITEDKAGALFSIPSSCSNAGAYEAIPAGDFSITAKVRDRAQINTTYLGIGLYENGASSTGDAVMWWAGRASATSLHLYLYWLNDYSSFNSALLDTSLAPINRLLNTYYFRVRRTGTTYSFDFSVDGVSWNQDYSGSLSFTPTHFGPAAACFTNAGSLVEFDFFRYTASDVGAHGIMNGRRVGVFAPP